MVILKIIGILFAIIVLLLLFVLSLRLKLSVKFSTEEGFEFYIKLLCFKFGKSKKKKKKNDLIITISTKPTNKGITPPSDSHHHMAPCRNTQHNHKLLWSLLHRLSRKERFQRPNHSQTTSNHLGINLQISSPKIPSSN
jgi:hypothetical protein